MTGLRVCIDARMIGGTSGGLEQVIVGLAHGLSGLSDGEEEYLLLAHSGTDWLAPYVREPCRILWSSQAPRSLEWARTLNSPSPLARSAWRVLDVVAGYRTIRVPAADPAFERARADVVHFTTQNGFRTDVPSVYHPHDLQHLHLPELFTRRERRSREILYRALCEQARMVTVTASWGKRDLIRNYGLDEEKVRVVPLAPVLEAYSIPSEEDLARAREKFLLPEKFVFYPAQTWPHKNHLGLLEALAILRDDYGLSIPLVSSGRLTRYFPVIQRRARRLKLVDSTQFLGFVSPLELRCLYELCQSVVIPSKFEAASFPLWEAFLAGAPAACSDVTSLPEQADDAAIVFDAERPGEIADAMFRLWTDKSLGDELVERGRRNVARFTWDHTARLFRAHYRRIAGRSLTSEDRALLTMPPPL